VRSDAPVPTRIPPGPTWSTAIEGTDRVSVLSVFRGELSMTTTATRAPRRETARPKGAANATRITVPLLGTVGPPSRDQLVFLGGLGALAVIGVLDWPVAAVVGAGHLLAARRNSRALREIGEAMEQA
jgi:hypothetical protein